MIESNMSAFVMFDIIACCGQAEWVMLDIIAYCEPAVQNSVFKDIIFWFFHNRINWHIFMG